MSSTLPLSSSGLKSFPKAAEHVLHMDFPNVPMIVHMSRKLENIAAKLTEAEYRELNAAFVIAAKHIARLESDHVEKEVLPLGAVPRSTFGSQGEHRSLLSSSYRDTQETSVIEAHIHRLEEEVVSLSKQLQFVKDHHREKEKQSYENTQSLVRQVQNMTNLYEQVRREHEASYELLHDKEREQALTLVHLTKAQEEIKRLLNERGKVEKSKQQREHELNDLLQKQSKYSSTQFVALSAQLDAMRSELHKERSQRSHERYSHCQENSILKDKVQALESIVVSQNLKLQHYTQLDLHVDHSNKPASLPTVTEVSPKKQRRLAKEEQDESDLSLQSEPMPLLASSSPNRNLKSLPSSFSRSDKAPVLPQQQQAGKKKSVTAGRSKSAPRLASRELPSSTSSSRSNTPVRSIRNKAFQKSLRELQDQLKDDHGSLSPSLRSNRQKMLNKLNQHIDDSIEESIVLRSSAGAVQDGDYEAHRHSPQKGGRDGHSTDVMSRSEFDTTHTAIELSSIMPNENTTTHKLDTPSTVDPAYTRNSSPLRTGHTVPLVGSPLQVVTSFNAVKTPNKDEQHHASHVHLQFVETLPVSYSSQVKSPGPPASSTTIYDSDNNVKRPTQSSPRSASKSASKVHHEINPNEHFLKPQADEDTSDENEDFQAKRFVECLTLDGKPYIQACTNQHPSSEVQDIPSTFVTLLQLHNQTVADYNNLLYTYNQNQQQNHYVKSMYKDDIHDSISIERGLQNQLHTVTTENEFLHDKLLQLEGEQQRLFQQIEDLEDAAEHHRQQALLLDGNDAVQLSPRREREPPSSSVPKLVIDWDELQQDIHQVDISELIDELQDQMQRIFEAFQRDEEDISINVSMDFLQTLVSYLDKCRQRYESLQTHKNTNEEHAEHTLQELQTSLAQKDTVISNQQQHIDALQKASLRAEEQIRDLKRDGEQLQLSARKREDELLAEARDKKQLNAMQEQLHTTLEALEEMKRLQQETASTNQQLLLRQEAIMEERKAGSPLRSRSRTASSPLGSPRSKGQDHSLLHFKDQVEEMKQALHQDPLFSKFYAASNNHPDSLLDDSDTDASQPTSGKSKHSIAGERGDDWRDFTTRSNAGELHRVDASYVAELEERLRHSETRVVLLNETIQSVPVSLTVAQAEKRVLEGKLEKALTAYEVNIQRIQQHAVQRVQEVTSFLELEKREKDSLRGKLKEQNETIHQLTHHLKLLNANQHVNTGTQGNMGLYSNGSVGYTGVPVSVSGGLRSSVTSNGHSMTISHAQPPVIDVHTMALAPWDETALPTLSASAGFNLRASYPAASSSNHHQHNAHMHTVTPTANHNNRESGQRAASSRPKR